MPAVMLADLTTLGLGGPAPEFTVVRTPDEVAEAVGGRDVLVVGGGSNLVVADAGVSVPVVRIGIGGLDRQPAGDGTDLVTIGAGRDWDEVVAELTAEGCAELAPLSGIPGSVGATPVQNVGAYGAEIADVLTEVEVFDRSSRRRHRLAASELALGYRSSMLRGTDRAVVLSVTLRLHQGESAVRYAELARTLGVPVGGTAPPQRVREAVLELRRGKGMVLDPADPDTRSAGSFFTNPILSPVQLTHALAAIDARLGPEVSPPRYPVAGTDATKLSAAWLIERAGFGKGYRGPGGRVRISSKHTLALTNTGGSTADLLALAREIRDGVQAAFGVRLEPEPVLVGVRLD